MQQVKNLGNLAIPGQTLTLKSPNPNFFLNPK